MAGDAREWRIERVRYDTSKLGRFNYVETHDTISNTSTDTPLVKTDHVL